MTCYFQEVIQQPQSVNHKYNEYITADLLKYAIRAQELGHDYVAILTLGECMALWGKPNELSIQHCVYILMQYANSQLG